MLESRCKNIINILVSVIGEIRPHEEERVLDTRIPSRELSKLKKMSKGDRIEVHKLVIDTIKMNDPMRCKMDLVNAGIKGYEVLTPTENIHVNNTPSPKKRNRSPPPHPKKRTSVVTPSPKNPKNKSQPMNTSMSLTPPPKKSKTVVPKLFGKKPGAKVSSITAATVSSVGSPTFNVVNPYGNEFAQFKTDLGIIKNDVQEMKSEIKTDLGIFKKELQEIKSDMIRLTDVVLNEIRAIGEKQIGFPTDMSFTQLLQTPDADIPMLQNKPSTPSTITKTSTLSTITKSTTPCTITKITPAHPDTETNPQNSIDSNMLQPQPNTDTSPTFQNNFQVPSTITDITPLQTNHYPYLNPFSQSTLFQPQVTPATSYQPQDTQATPFQPPQVTRAPLALSDLANPLNPIWALIIVKAKSREALAWYAVKKLFSDEQMKGRNCSGVTNVKNRKKLQLDPSKLLMVRAICYHYYPCRPHEDSSDSWRKCEKAIDGHLRQKFKGAEA